jgi:hypothetical protein
MVVQTLLPKRPAIDLSRQGILLEAKNVHAQHGSYGKGNPTDENCICLPKPWDPNDLGVAHTFHGSSGYSTRDVRVVRDMQCQ